MGDDQWLSDIPRDMDHAVYSLRSDLHLVFCFAARSESLEEFKMDLPRFYDHKYLYRRTKQDGYRSTEFQLEGVMWKSQEFITSNEMPSFLSENNEQAENLKAVFLRGKGS